MRYLLALFLPWLSLILQGKLIQGLICLILQITLIGWIPATIWAFMSINQMYADRRTNKIVRAINSNSGASINITNQQHNNH